MDTPPNTVQPERPRRRPSKFQRFALSPLNILFVIVPILCLAGDIIARPAESARTKVDRQLQQIRSVDASSLLGYFGKDLHSHTCDWRLHCTLNPQERPGGPGAAVALDGSASAFSQHRQDRYLAQLHPGAGDAAATSQQPIGADGAPLSLAEAQRELAPQRLAAAPPGRNATPEGSPSSGTPTTPDDNKRALDLQRLALRLKAENPRQSFAPVGVPTSPVDQQRELALQRLEASNAAETAQHPILPRIKHDILGTPHALLYTLINIWYAGPWAVGMLLSATVIFYALWRLPGSNHPKDSHYQYLILGFFVFVPLFVQVLQFIVGVLLHAVSWALGGIVLFFTYATALRAAAELWEVGKAPREIHEAVNVIRNP